MQVARKNFLHQINRHKYLILLFLLSIIPLYSLFTKDLIYTQDGWTHLIRGAAYFKVISTFHFPVRWAGDLNYGYGMPLFIFVFQFPYIFYSALVGIGVSLADAFKILIVSSYLFSGFFMYLFAKEFFGDKKNALIVALLYQFFPYRFVDLLLRGSIGEAFAFTFLPLMLYGIIGYEKKKSSKYTLLIVLGSALLVLSHLATGVNFIGIGILFAIFTARKVRTLLITLTSTAIGIFGASYYWIPALLEHKYTYGDLFAQNLYQENFVSISKLFYPNILNSETLRIGDVSVSIGIVHAVILIALILLALRLHRNSVGQKRIIIFCLIIAVPSILMMLPPSGIFWEKVSLLRQFQFPWRFLAPLGFALSIGGGVVLGKLLRNRIIFALLIFCIVASTIGFWKPILGYKKIREAEYWNYPLTTTYFGETDVIWSEGPAKNYPKSRVEVIGGKAKITGYKKDQVSHEFLVNASEGSRILLHTQYFPGWRIYVNDQKKDIQFQDQNHRGEITFEVDKGVSEVRAIFGESKIRLISNLFSLATIILLYPYIMLVRKFRDEK